MCKLKILLIQKYPKGIRQRIKVEFNVGRNCRLCICRYTAQNVRSFLNSVFHLQSPGTFAKILLFFTSVFAILHSLTVIKEAKTFRANNVRITGVFCYICLRIATKNLSSWTDIMDGMTPLLTDSLLFGNCYKCFTNRRTS